MTLARSTPPPITRTAVLFRRLARWYRARTNAYPDWKRLLNPARWTEALERARQGPRLLIGTSVGAFLPGTTMESLLAAALTLRGARAEVLLCDAVIPACLESAIRWHPGGKNFDRRGLTGALCHDCFSPAQKAFQAMGLRIHRYGDFLLPEEVTAAEETSRAIPLKDISGYRLDGAAVGEHAQAGTLRFFARGTLQEEPEAEFVLRSYFKAALLSAYSVRRLLQKERFEAAVFHHGIYVPQGILGEIARRQGVRVVNWNPAYRKKCFVFSHGHTYHFTLMDEPVSTWEAMEWTPALETRTLEYLKSRWKGTQDWIWFHERPEVSLEQIEKETGVNFSKPCVGLLTNVFWDAQLHYPSNAFPNMLAWVLRTIEYFRKRPDLQLLIRIHPAEVRGTIPSRQPMAEEIRKAFPTLPPNVFVVAADSPVSTYAAMLQCNAVLIYGTKTGVELASQGIPVVVAGEAWVRNKGVTIDARSEPEYFAILDRLPFPGRMSEEQTRRARMYAYHFFFRRMIPLDFIQPVKGWPLYRLPPDVFDWIQPGRSSGLDLICSGILRGSEFVYTES